MIKKFLVLLIKFTNVILLPILLLILYAKRDYVPFFALSTFLAVISLVGINGELSIISAATQRSKARELAVEILQELEDIEKGKTKGE